MKPLYHQAALLSESITALAIQPDGIYVDVTFGGGGHSRAILGQLSSKGKLFAFDQDEDATANALYDERFRLLPYNFRYIQRFLKVAGITQVDGILADLGVSSHQFDSAERGFSFRFDAGLDMRMSQKMPLSAADVLNTYDEKRLADLFFQYGEVKSARRLAAAIVQSRRQSPIRSTGDLLTLINSVLQNSGNSVYAQIFQALRIEVNEELQALKEMLTQSAELLRPEGRLVVISYHSLEDRLVKNFMKHGNFEGISQKDIYGKVAAPLSPLHQKVIVPAPAEISSNSRARSAKLRSAVKN
ncbi:MAG: 16S rRNA (cytosine(1402)-N(4))-methyltransferase RsmH [Sphingobacteriales bacterium]|nr:16S rRNA (cytosine(1402)-N(4))-methyltransferase RsmH [Sphingobacteriales bacterium]